MGGGGGGKRGLPDNRTKLALLIGIHGDHIEIKASWHTA